MNKLDERYLSPGNSKTGDCWSFDLPARITCPGKTKECSKDCYAARLMAIYKSVDAKYQRNLKFIDDPNFVSYMIEVIPKDSTGRIHISGDFRDGKYVQKWIKILKARPDIFVYGYSRSWRIPEILTQLLKLTALPNVNINLSVDDETGQPKFLARDLFRYCYLTKTDNVPDWIRKNDIVFRSNHIGHKRRRKNAKKRGDNPNIVAPLQHVIGQGTVCPLERGQDIPNFSCAKCRLCVDKPKIVLYATN